MKALLHPGFLISVFLYGLKWMLPLLGVKIPLLQNYLADLVCLPVVLTLALVFMRSVGRKGPSYRLNWLQVVFAFVYFCVFFEWFLPSRSDRYTGDLWDVVAYGLGALIFFFWINRKQSKLPAEPVASPPNL